MRKLCAGVDQAIARPVSKKRRREEERNGLNISDQSHRENVAEGQGNELKIFLNEKFQSRNKVFVSRFFVHFATLPLFLLKMIRFENNTILPEEGRTSEEKARITPLTCLTQGRE